MKVLHIIPHTHWDREWYRSADAFLSRLVTSIDLILKTLEENDEFLYYVLDGQTAVIEDYLKVKPQNSERLAKFVQNGRLFIGPWYIQPDLNLVDGESLIRNLMIGMRYAHKFGKSMNLGWIPDAFGQIQGTPQLFKSFNLEGIFVWRGFDYEMLSDSYFIWRSPDGSVLPSMHFPLGYGHYRYFPNNTKKMQEELDIVLKQIANRFKSNQYLFMQGSDHARIQPELPQLLEQQRPWLKERGFGVKITNPEAFLQETKAAFIGEPIIFEGEARSPKLGRIHAGITSTRMDIKGQMRHFERLITQVVEPMGTLLKQYGYDYSQDIINYFWKILFKNQFHDSIYSSSPETVNQSVQNRLLNLRHGLHELIWLGHRFLMKNIKLEKLAKDETILTLFNTQPYTKKNVQAKVTLYLETRNFVIVSDKNEMIPYVVLQEISEVSNEIEGYNGLFHLNDEKLVEDKKLEKMTLLLEIPIFDALSYRVLKVQPYQNLEVNMQTDLYLEDEMNFGNDYLHITIQENGTLGVFDKIKQQVFHDILLFEDKLDDGDEYNYAPPKQQMRKTTQEARPIITLIENNVLCIQYRIQHQFCFDKVKDAGREGAIQFSTDIILRKGSRSIEFKTTLHNTVDNHMLRVLFPALQKSEVTFAQDHFGFVKRSNHIDNSEDIKKGIATELQLPIYTLNNAVMMTKHPDFILLSKTVSEYEVYDDQTMSLTLLRAVGDLGKVDLTTRPGRASGYHLKTPTSQMKMMYTLEYAMSFVQPDELNFELSKYQYQPEIRHIKTIHQYETGTLSWESDAVVTLPHHLEMMALKRSEDGTFDVLRIVNRKDTIFKNTGIDIHQKYREVWILDSLEQKKEQVEIIDNKIIIPHINKMAFLTLGLFNKKEDVVQ